MMMVVREVRHEGQSGECVIYLVMEDDEVAAIFSSEKEATEFIEDNDPTIVFGDPMDRRGLH